MSTVIIGVCAVDDTEIRFDAMSELVALIVKGEREIVKNLLRLCARRPSLLLSMVKDFGTFLGDDIKDGKPVDVSTYEHSVDWCGHSGHDEARRTAQSYLNACVDRKHDGGKAAHGVVHDWMYTLSEENCIDGLVCFAGFLFDTFAVVASHEMRDDNPAMAKFADAHPVGAK